MNLVKTFFVSKERGNDDRKNTKTGYIRRMLTVIKLNLVREYCLALISSLTYIPLLKWLAEEKKSRKTKKFNSKFNEFKSIRIHVYG